MFETVIYDGKGFFDRRISWVKEFVFVLVKRKRGRSDCDRGKVVMSCERARN
jgi:hypothetical protein